MFHYEREREILLDFFQVNPKNNQPNNFSSPFSHLIITECQNLLKLAAQWIHYVPVLFAYLAIDIAATYVWLNTLSWGEALIQLMRTW